MFLNLGTSMATPTISGLATLVRQYYLEGFYPEGSRNASNGFGPTGALVKATLIHSTLPLLQLKDAGMTCAQRRTGMN